MGILDKLKASVDVIAKIWAAPKPSTIRKSSKKKRAGKSRPPSRAGRRPKKKNRSVAVRKAPRSAGKSRAKVCLKPPQTPKAARVAPKTNEQYLGSVSHYFPKVHAAVLLLDAGKLEIGDRIHIAGKKNDFVQPVRSMQIDRKPISEACSGQEIGIEVKRDVDVGDRILKILPGKKRS